MKTFSMGSIMIKMVVSVFILLILFSTELYGKKSEFLVSSVVPAARGSVKVTKDKNMNFEVKVEIFGLAEVSRLQPARKTYVVWMVTDQDLVKNIGQLKSSTGLISKALKAHLETVTTFKPVRIFITAENDGALQEPGSETIITTDRF